MFYLRYLCLLAYNGVQHILCCVFLLFVFVLYTSFSGLFIFDYLYAIENPLKTNIYCLLYLLYTMMLIQDKNLWRSLLSFYDFVHNSA